MTDYVEGLLMSSPSPLGVVRAEAASIMRRYRGTLVFVTILLLYFGLTPTFVPQDAIQAAIFRYGRPAFPGSLFFALLGTFWGISVWADFPPGKRDSVLSLPVGNLGRMGYRCLAGAVILLCLVIITFVVSGILCDWIAPATGYFSTTLEFWLAGFLWTLLALLNAYLLGTLLATWVRRPDLWLVGALTGALLLALLAFSLHIVAVQKTVAYLYMLVAEGTGIWVPGFDAYAAPDPPTIPILSLAAVLGLTVPFSLARARE